MNTMCEMQAVVKSSQGYFRGYVTNHVKGILTPY